MGNERDVRFRKAVVGVALLAAPLLSVISWVLVPTSMVRGTEFVSDVAEIDTGVAALSQVTGTLFFPLAVLGILGLLHLLKGRESLVGTIGGGLAIVGLTLNTVALGAVGTLAQAVYSDVDRVAAAGLVEDTMNGLTGMLALAGVLLAAIGTTMLGVALYRAHTVARGVAACLAVYGPIQAVAFGMESIALITVSYGVMAMAFMPVGWWIVRCSPEEWRQPPAFGLREVGRPATVS